MTTIVSFLRARLDEDQQTAEAASRCSSPNWVKLGSLLLARHGEVAEPDVFEATHYRYDDALTHASRHDPARVLAEIDANRRIIERYERALDMPASVASRTRGQDDGYREACWDAIVDAAAVYADHPDYPPNWSPQQ